MFELLEQPAPLVGEAARHGDVDEHALVAAAEALQHRHALAAQHAHVAWLRAGLERQLDGAVERLDADGRAERRLDDREVDLREDVVALAHEALVGTHAHEHVRVAGAAAERAGVALAGEADALAVVDAGRDVDVELARLECAARAVARLARVLDHLSAPTALRARRRADELAEEAARDLLQTAAPAAAVAPDRLRAGLDAVAAARRAGHGGLERHRHLRPAR